MSSHSMPTSTLELLPTKNVIVDGVLRFPPTGFKALVVGAGVGGMMTALECWRKGIDVEIVEKATKISALGDIFAIGPSAITTLHHYPSMLKEYDELAHDAHFSIVAKDGTAKMPPVEFEWNQEGVAPNGAYPLRIKTLCGRNTFAEMLSNQCKRLGIHITFGVAIEAYEEDITKGTATALTLDGRRFTADVVIAADGIGTKSHAVTLGHPVKALKTGFITYRAMYSTEHLKGVPIVEDAIQRSKRPALQIFTSHKTHWCVISLTESRVSVGITTEEDDNSATESWSSTVSNQRALSALPEPDTWSPLVRELVLHAPEQSIIRWSLCFRDPQPRWTSFGGRIVQLGDSAHSFLPTSGNGACQALEDANSLPECLRLGAKEGIAIATKVHELLRYQRVSLVQHTGFVNMQDFHRDDAAKSDRTTPPLLMGKWLWAHNPEKYATENFAKARAHLEKGGPFENTNLPPGHKWKPWTMEGELSKQRAGIMTIQELKQNGDWGLV
ncbi:FAD/NAD(P)-binding domain-containing protein [Hypoxylon crocopeplum]|nr:FAD/NAD(P)-binding domain-containing protein [Hypoxylon crocopeplum]